MTGQLAERDTDDGVYVRGWARLRGYDVDDLEYLFPQWSRRTRERRHALASGDLPINPVFEVTASNMVLDNFLEALARGANPSPSHLAVGDGTTAPDPGNDALNNEHYRTVVGQDEQSGLDRLTSTFISQNEANGEAIREIGFTNGPREGNWTQLTHLVLDEGDQIAEKDSNTAITIDYVLEFRRL